MNGAGRKKGDVGYKREKTRTKVMYGLLGILALTIIGTFTLAWVGKPIDTFIQTVLPLLTTLIGSALGFYFGGRERDEEEEEEKEEVTSSNGAVIAQDQNSPMPPDKAPIDLTMNK